MNNFWMLLIIIVVVTIALSMTLLLSYLGYWLVLAAGGPKYVAVIVGIAIFVASGISTGVRAR